MATYDVLSTSPPLYTDGNVRQTDDGMRQRRTPLLFSIRSSIPFITFVIAYAVFTDQFLFAVVVPVAPFALSERMHVPEDRVQYWVALLLGVYGIACFVSSGEACIESGNDTC